MLYPKIVFIESTNLCNAHCIMCPNDKISRARGIMSFELFKKIIDDCASIPNYIYLNLHKEGEPLLDKELPAKISYARKVLGENVYIGISTNASLLTEEKAKAILNAGIDKVIISMDGATKEYYENIRLGLRYEDVFNNTIKYIKLRDQINPKSSVIIQMISDESEKSQQEAKNFVDIWKNFRCKIFIKRMHSYLDGGHSSITSKKQDTQTQICTDPFRMIVISCDGNATMCCWDYNNEYTIGNVKNESIVELFNNEKAKTMRIKQNNKDCFDLNPCSRCERIFGYDYITSEETAIDLE